jgi:hypothetical protein
MVLHQRSGFFARFPTRSTKNPKKEQAIYSYIMETTKRGRRIMTQ